ncbi:glycoside hydrolase family 15 protein [Parasphingorhabdus pacifica]
MTGCLINSHALVSDRHSAGLVNTEGTIDWLCLPRFDSSAVFASILDDTAGHWAVRPVGRARVERAYVGESMVLRTTFRTAEGTLELLDCMALPEAPDPHRLGENAPHTLVRGLRCTSGRVTIEMRFVPRPEYGLVVPVLTEHDGGVVATGGPNRLTLSAPVLLHCADGEASAWFELDTDQRVFFALRHSSLGETIPGTESQEQISAALDSTLEGWRAWAAVHQAYEGPWPDLVNVSGRVLQALSYQPTGAIIAAPTTSLPERVGGERNWDYRYSWVRDASFTLRALRVATCPDEAAEFFDFIATAAAHADPDCSLQIMFGITGERDLSERHLPWLAGWRGSSPVRVGNGAWAQTQLDVYGELLDAVSRVRDQIGELAPGTRRFLTALADTAARQWQLPDNGIWEVRGQPRHFLHSKVMCWVALDRSTGMANLLHAEHRAAAWAKVADEIRQTVLSQGWNERLGAFTQSFGGHELDATALLLPLVGILPAEDPRVLSTIDVIREELVDERGLVRRYRPESGIDGLAGGEGTFLLCTFWLARALAAAGRVDQAREAFERAAGHVNDVGLLAEEIDPSTGEQLGNFPQAFSHVGLINAAWTIHQAEQGQL